MSVHNFVFLLLFDWISRKGVGVLPAIGGKKTAKMARKTSELHMAPGDYDLSLTEVEGWRKRS